MLARVAAFGLVFLSLAAVSPCVAQGYAPSRAGDGHPDLQGVWESRWRTPVERPPQASALVLTAEQAAAMTAAMEAGRKAAPGNTNPDSDIDLAGLAMVKGEYRSSLVIDPPDGRLPFTDQGRALRTRIDSSIIGARDNPEERPATERCVGGPGRAPMLTVPTNGYLRIIQSPGHVVLHSEALDDVRILRLGGGHGPAAVLDLQGDSIARWEGDTLVVETNNFRPDDIARLSPPFSIIVLSPGATVTERFTRVSDREIVYAFTVSDPAIYTRPWTAETSFVRTSARMYEYACHEANYSIVNVLRGGRETEKQATAPKPQQ